jgi:hypothetical protein
VTDVIVTGDFRDIFRSESQKEMKATLSAVIMSSCSYEEPNCYSRILLSPLETRSIQFLFLSMKPVSSYNIFQV